MKNILIMVVAGIGLFSVTVIGMLAATGRLDYEGTKGIPIIHGLFSPAEKNTAGPDEGDDGSQDGQQGESPELRDDPLQERRGRALGGLMGSQQEPETDRGSPAQSGDDPRKGETPDEAQHRQRMEALLGKGEFRDKGLFDFQAIPAGLDVQAINDMWRRAKAALEETEQREAALDEAEKLLAIREQDLHDREEALATKMKEVEAAQRQLDAKIVQFNDEVKLVRPDDEAALKATARTLSSMDAEMAAGVVQEWWMTEEGQDRALKVLSVMANDSLDSIVAALPVQLQRDFLEKRLLLIKPAPKTRR